MDSLNNTTTNGGTPYFDNGQLHSRRASTSTTGAPERQSLAALIAQKERELQQINEYRAQALEADLAEAVSWGQRRTNTMPRV